MAIRDDFDTEIDDLGNVGTNAKLKTLEKFMSSKTRLREGDAERQTLDKVKVLHKPMLTHQRLCKSSFQSL